MKNAGKIFSLFCLGIIVTIHMIQYVKPFEWQRQPRVEDLSVEQIEQLIEGTRARNSGFTFPHPPNQAELLVRKLEAEESADLH